MTRIAVVATFLAIAVLSGCGASEGDSQSAVATHQRAPQTSIDTSLLRGAAGEMDYASMAMPELVAATGTAVVGVVDRWAAGETWYEVPGAREKNAVLRIKVDKRFRQAPGVDDGGMYVRLPRGGEAYDPETMKGDIDEGAESTVATVADLEAGMPVGTPVLLFAVEAGRPQGAGTVVDEYAGRPKGAALFVPYTPDAFVARGADGIARSGLGDDAALSRLLDGAGANKSQVSFDRLVTELNSVMSHAAKS